MTGTFFVLSDVLILVIISKPLITGISTSRIIISGTVAFESLVSADFGLFMGMTR